ncbi:MAG: DNA repair protein RadC [Chitinispirillaceae bacterium]|nr:DNA repair protein RadC [Chitinispirillaceae bacterium]
MTKKRITDLPIHDRPREKLVGKGAAALSDRELLAVLLGKGTARMDVLTLAEKLARVLDEKGLGVTIDDLTAFEGIGNAKAALLVAALEYARRRIKPAGISIRSPADIVPHLRHYADRKQEHVICATVNGANEILNIRVIAIGLVDRAPVHPREVFADAMTDRASAIILAHNHPAGSTAPSPHDREITRQVKASGDLLGIALLDHVIFTRNSYFSFLEAGLL